MLVAKTSQKPEFSGGKARTACVGVAFVAVPECPQKDTLENSMAEHKQPPSLLRGFERLPWIADKLHLILTEHLPVFPDFSFT